MSAFAYELANVKAAVQRAFRTALAGDTTARRAPGLSALGCEACGAQAVRVMI